MDDALEALISSGISKGTQGEVVTESKLRFSNGVSPEIEVTGPAGTKKYTLKPMQDLYGRGTGKSSVDPRSTAFFPLLMAIEEEIVRYNRIVDRSLTEGSVLLTLEQLLTSPEIEPAEDLGKRISLALRLTLSLNNYSRHDLRGCLRQVIKSVERHTREKGPGGYLRFIGEFFDRMARVG